MKLMIAQKVATWIDHMTIKNATHYFKEKNLMKNSHIKTI
jgi:hypothetical protein